MEQTTVEKLRSIVENWNFEAHGKINQRAIRFFYPISKKSIEKNYSEVIDLINAKNKSNASRIKVEQDNRCFGNTTRRGIKDSIIELRKAGKSFDFIQKELKCSKATINYHCEREGLLDIGISNQAITAETKAEIYEYTKTHTTPEAMKHFGIGRTAIKKYRFKKPQTTSEQTRAEIKEYVKTHSIKDTAKKFGVSRNTVVKHR